MENTNVAGCCICRIQQGKTVVFALLICVKKKPSYTLPFKECNIQIHKICPNVIAAAEIKFGQGVGVACHSADTVAVMALIGVIPLSIQTLFIALSPIP